MPAFRLGAAVIAQAVQDAGLGIALGRNSPNWHDALSALRFLLIDLWVDTCIWNRIVLCGIPKSRLIDMIVAQTGHAAFHRCVVEMGLPEAVLRRG